MPSATDSVSRLTPYVQELLDNDYARDNLRDGADKLRDAYQRSRKRRVQAAHDGKLRRQLGIAAVSLAEGGRALSSGRRKPKKSKGRRLLLVLGIGALGAGVALAVSEDLRDLLQGRGESSSDGAPEAS
jgi:hypothetical protein